MDRRDLNIPLRVAAILGCALLGFVFPLMFALAAFIAWALVDDLRRPAPAPLPPDAPRERPPRREPPPMTVGEMRDLCDSPAETALLDALVAAFALAPARDGLEGGGLRLRAQVRLPPYRVDFLVDDRLVVEVDGAAWHSSPEAVARDAARDADLQAQGYTVLRLPAKVTLYAPSDAVTRVRAARDALSRVGPESAPVTAPPAPSPAEAEAPATPSRREPLTLGERAQNLADRALVDLAVQRLLLPMETVVGAASRLALLDADRDELAGIETDRERMRGHYRAALERIAPSLAGERPTRETLADLLPRLRDAASREGGRALCETAIGTAVDAHLGRLSEAIRSLFPDEMPVRRLNFSTLTPLEELVAQLRGICLDGADPALLAHPYRPRFGAEFDVWWSRTVSGRTALERVFDAVETGSESADA